LKSRRSWVGVICCCLIFVAICFTLVIDKKGVFHAHSHPQLGLLLFILPGVMGAVMLQQRQVVLSLAGAVLALPFCYLIIHQYVTPLRPFWQEMAWLFSAVFWCGIGALGCLFVRSMMRWPRPAQRIKRPRS